jgi:hypothetical protein
MQSGVAAERTSLDPLGAGALLAGVLFACVGAGVIGIPAAIFSVYRRYSGTF